MEIEATGNADSSPFNRLPDEIVLQILNKLIDLKTLCFSYAVCKRFCSIVVQVDTVSYTAPPGFLWRNREVFKKSAIRSLKSFTCAKHVSIVLPSSSINTGHLDYEVDFDDDSLLRWKINFGDSFHSFVFISINSVYETSDEYDEEEEEEEEREIMFGLKEKVQAASCLTDAMLRLWILFDCNNSLPLLENISIKDSRGTVSVSGGKLADSRNLLPGPSEEYTHSSLDTPPRKYKCFIPLLKLPVSGYVLTGVTFILHEWDNIPDEGDYSFIFRDLDDDDTVEDKDEAAYAEAMAEILKKFREN